MVGVGRHRGPAGDVVSISPRETGRPAHWWLLGTTTPLLMFHAAGWVAAAIILGQRATLHVPRVQSAVAIALGILVVRAASGPRRSRRLVVISTLALAAVAFVAIPLAHDFQGERIDVDAATSRVLFDDRFRVGHGVVNFHSHLGDILMALLDATFGASETSPSRSYDALSMLAGLLFLLELGLAAAWHKWSRQSCRYVGLALALPLSLLFFGYRALGYLSIAAGVVPLLALARSRSPVQADASTLLAGFVQGFHTALHGFGLLGVAGGALAALSGRGDKVRRVVRSLTFTSAAVAFYLGWVFLYLTIGGLSINWSRNLGARPLFEPTVLANRIAAPLLSLDGLGEFGVLSALAGVPLLAVALASRRRAARVPVLLYALPSVVFLVRWWPDNAPYNSDLLLSVFPGVFAACWAAASSDRRSRVTLVVLVGWHVLLWTILGGNVILRPWADAP
jgi:hypothetical protein